MSKAAGPKSIKAVVSLMVPSCKAAPSPAIGQSLGALGVNMMEFCKLFNKRTENYNEGIMLPVVLTAYTDRSFDFVTKSPTVAFLLKKAAGIETGSGLAGREIVGEVTVQQVYEIAKLKQKDAHLSLIPLKSLCRSIVSTAHSCGIRVVNLKEIAAKEATLNQMSEFTEFLGKGRGYGSLGSLKFGDKEL